MKKPKIIENIPKGLRIVLMESDSNYTIINLENGRKLISSYSLKYHEQISKDQLFFRPNRSFLINRSFIQNINQETSTITLQNGRTILISRRRKLRFSSKEEFAPSSFANPKVQQ